MSGAAGLVVAPEARIYDHGPQHPLRPQRVLLTWDLIAEYGIDREPHAVRLGAEPDRVWFAVDPVLGDQVPGQQHPLGP